jgi:hypothetical protein
MKTKKAAGAVSAIVLIALLLSACSSAAGSPTPDAQAIFTAAAQTVQAQLTQTQAAKPTNTNTPLPSATSTQATTPTLSTTMIAALPGIGTPGLPGLPAVGTAKPAVLPTSAVRAPSSGDKAEWVSQDPADGAVIDPNVGFDLTWYVKNTGTTTWTKDYKIRYYIGDRFTKQTEFKLLWEVTPGQTGKLIADAIAPSTAGTYKTTFVITNKDGANFYVIDATIKVGNSAAATASTDATATPHSYSWVCIDKDRSAGYTECWQWCTDQAAAGSTTACYYQGKLWTTDSPKP